MVNLAIGGIKWRMLQQSVTAMVSLVELVKEGPGELGNRAVNGLSSLLACSIASVTPNMPSKRLEIITIGS